MPTPTDPSVVAEVAPWVARAAKEWGIFATMCLFFIFWSYTREKALTARIEAQDLFIRDRLLVTLDNNTKAFERFEARLLAAERK